MNLKFLERCISLTQCFELKIILPELWTVVGFSWMPRNCVVVFFYIMHTFTEQEIVVDRAPVMPGSSEH